MPEVITRYPDIVLKLLNDVGAACGEGLPQKILRSCPPENFCSLPTGELCVYGLDEIQQMTQIGSADFAQVVSIQPILTLEMIFLIVIALIVGIILGFMFRKNKKD